MADKPEEQHEQQVKAYERMLDRLREMYDQADSQVRPHLRDAIVAVRDRAVELGELSREESDRVAAWLQRDIEEAAQFTASTDEDLNTWLRMDIQLVENWIWDRFSSVADRTRLEWLELQRNLQEWSEYHTGEVAGPGALACKNCGETLTFKKPGHIPPCPKCRGSVFERVSAREAKGKD
jgi:hypothetical protein